MALISNHWSDEARAASLEVRRAKARERAKQAMMERKRREFFEANPGASEADWKAHDAKQLREWQQRKDMERWLEANPGKTESDWEAHDQARLEDWRRRRDEAEAEIFRGQLDAPRARGEFFVEYWYPRGEDGALSSAAKRGEAVSPIRDPHWGAWSDEAPYGYHDQTGQPRKEPLYDRYGRPIVPRLPGYHYRGRRRKDAAIFDWLDRYDRALDQWGHWGKGGKG